jgi:cytochrome c
MSKRVLLIALIALASLAHADQPADQTLGIGKTIGEREVSATGISVLPSGLGLPDGRGRADEGRKIYVAKCASCHGENGEGRPGYSALVGGRGSLTSEKPQFTVGSYWPTATTLFDYVWRAMPYEAPGSLSADEVYALIAWILSANDITKPGAVMDRAALLKVKMPNADGFERPGPTH